MKDFTFSALALVVVTYAVAHWIAELVKWYWSVTRLRNALVIEAIVTLNKVRVISKDVAKTLKGLEPYMTDTDQSKQLDNEQIRSISAGYVVVLPSMKLEDLVPLAWEYEGKLVIYFLDAWKRFAKYGELLADAHERLLKASDKPSDNDATLKEYSEQAVGYLCKMRRIAAELMIYSIRVIRFERPNLCDPQLLELSDGVCSSKQKMDDDFQKYTSIWDDPIKTLETVDE